MVKRLRAEEESEESKVKRLCNKMRGDAREVSPRELEDVANTVEEIRNRVAAPFTIQELIASASDSALNEILETNIGNRCGGFATTRNVELAARSLAPELKNIATCISVLQDTYSHLYAKIATAYAKEYNKNKDNNAIFDHLGFRNAVEGQIRMREKLRLMDEARAAAHKMAHELARNMIANSKQQDVEMSN